jgi:hypothetical protein
MPREAPVTSAVRPMKVSSPFCTAWLIIWHLA